jgi:hypothetical protein
VPARLVDALVVMIAASAPVVFERLRGLSHVSSDLGGMFIPHYAWWWSRPRWLGGWNPWIFGGFPSNGDPLVGHVHPLGAIWWALSPLAAAAVEGAAAPALTGLGMLLYLRRVGAGRAGSIVGALAFACGGYVHAHGVHPEKLRTVLAIPWALVAIEALQGRRLLAGLAVAVAVAVAGGHPQTIAFALVLIAAYGAVFGTGRRAWVAAGLVVGIAIPAVTWMPALQLIGRSSHAHTMVTGIDHFTAACAHTLVVPFGCGGGQGPVYGRSFERFPGCGIVDCSGYPGMLPWLLLLVGLPGLWAAARGRFWLVVAVAGLALSTELTERVLPLPGVRAPSRALLWWSIGSAAAAALAFGSSTSRSGSGRRCWLATLGLLAVVGWTATRGPVARRASVASLGVLGATIAAVRSGSPAPMVAVLIGDLLLFGSELHAGAPATHLDAVRQELRQVGRVLDEHGGQGRALAVPLLFDAMWAQVERVPLLQGWNVLVPESFSRLLGGDAARVTGYEFALVRDAGLFAPESHVLDLLRTRLVLVDRAARRTWTLEEPRWRAAGGSQRWSYYVNERVRPVGWLVHRVRTMPHEEALRVVRGEEGSFDPATEALASEAIAVDPAAAGAGTVRVVEYAEDEIRLAAFAPAAALLVTSELASPGWVVQVDGRRAKLHAVNAGFRAVRLSTGEHNVVFRYRPGLGQGGLWFGALGIALVVACVLPRRPSARRAPADELGDGQRKRS